jgi:hypothetical protein
MQSRYPLPRGKHCGQTPIQKLLLDEPYYWDLRNLKLAFRLEPGAAAFRAHCKLHWSWTRTWRDFNGIASAGTYRTNLHVGEHVSHVFILGERS